MSLERIRKAILDEARAEADRLESEARARRDERLAAAARELELEFKRRFEAASENARREVERRLARRRAELNMELLRERNAILDRLFRQAAARLADSPDEHYQRVVAQWMKEIPQGVAGDVLCNERDAARLSPLIEKLNASRAPEARLRLVAGDRPAMGGVIFRTEKFEIDLSLDSRLAALRVELAPQVAKMIFGDARLGP